VTEPIVVERVVPVPPERAFDAWITESDLRVWMAPLTDVDLDVHVGGRFRIVMGRAEADGGPIEHTGEYRTIDRPHRLVFTWNSPYTQGESVITVDISPAGDGSRILLRHAGLPPETRDGHAGGWGTFLDAMASLTRSGGP
jgi:uncharacterized protein YndB with AHSA1/START domain